MKSELQPYILDNFEIRLSLVDSNLVIEAQNQQTSKTYSEQLNNYTTSRITNEVIQEAEGLYNILTTYLKDRNLDAKLSISKDAKLSFYCIFPGLDKILQFDIQLHEVDLDTMRNMEKQLSRLSTKVSNIENHLHLHQGKLKAQGGEEILKKLERLESRLSDVEKRIEKIEGGNEALLMDLYRRVGELEKNRSPTSKPPKEEKVEKLREKQIEPNKDVETIIPSFNSNPKNTEHFVFTNGNRTVTLKSDERFCVHAVNPLPKDKKVRFNVLIENGTQICVGVGPRSSLEKEMCDFEPEVCAYWCDNGDVFKDGKTIHSKFGGYRKGMIVSFITDLRAGSVEIEVDRNKVFQGEIDNHFKGEEMFPFVVMDKKGDSVRFIE